MMDRRDITPSCAICGGPGEPECPCEGERLKIAIEQAEKRWMEGRMAKTRDWVMNRAISYITTTFEQLKSQRRAKHDYYLQQLPYWPHYVQRRPLHPQILQHLQRQIQEANQDLKRGIDADWKSCVIRYPEVLAHFYGLVVLQFPEKPALPVLDGLTPLVVATIPAPQLLTQHSHAHNAPASAPAAPAPPQSTFSAAHPPLTRSATAPPKKAAAAQAYMAELAAARMAATPRPKPKHAHSSSITQQQHAPARPPSHYGLDADHGGDILAAAMEKLMQQSAMGAAKPKRSSRAGVGGADAGAAHGGGGRGAGQIPLTAASLGMGMGMPGFVPPQRANSVLQGTEAAAATRKKRRSSVHGGVGKAPPQVPNAPTLTGYPAGGMWDY